MWDSLKFLFLPTVDDPSVATVADDAWQFIHTFLEMEVSGKRPPVRRRPEVWKSRGIWVRGEYFRLKIIWVLKDQVIVKLAPGIFPNLVHEFGHALQARKGLPRGEEMPEDAEAAARIYGRGK